MGFKEGDKIRLNLDYLMICRTGEHLLDRNYVLKFVKDNKIMVIKEVNEEDTYPIRILTKTHGIDMFREEEVILVE